MLQKELQLFIHGQELKPAAVVAAPGETLR